MPVINIPDKNMVVNFPDGMDMKEIERSILTDIYGQPVLSQGEKPSLTDKAVGAVKDLFAGKDPNVGPLTEEDRQAFSPDNRFQLQEDSIPENAGLIKDVAATGTLMTIRGLKSLISPLLPAFKAMGMDTGEVLDTAIEYYRGNISPGVEIPNIGVGVKGGATGNIIDDVKNLEFQDRRKLLVLLAVLLGVLVS